MKPCWFVHGESLSVPLNYFYYLQSNVNIMYSGLMSKSGICQILVVHLLQRSLTLKLDLRTIRMTENHVAMHLEVLLILRRKGAGGTVILMWSATSLTSSPTVQISTLPYFLDQWKSITPIGFLLIIVEGHHIQLRCLHYSVILSGLSFTLL